MLENLKRAIPKFHEILWDSIVMILLILILISFFFSNEAILNKIFDIWCGLLMLATLTDFFNLVIEIYTSLNKAKNN